MKKNLTATELAVYNYISKSIKRDGYAPSVRDIMTALDLRSTSTVHSYIVRLEAKGYLHKEAGKSRTLRTETNVTQSRNVVKIPLLGRVAAGTPILAAENHEGYVEYAMTNRNLQPTELFALRISGFSMKDAGLLPNDTIVVQKTNYATNGDIVVALVEDEATVKRYYKENGHYRLQPENDEMEPIIVNDVFIVGKVVSMMRDY